MKKVIDINTGWNFNKKDQEISTVDLPHTFNLEDGNKGGEYYRDLVTYEKNLTQNFNSDQKVYLQVNAANSKCDVYIDGNYVTTHIGGYSRFNVDITDYVTSDKEFSVKLDVTNEAIEEVYPLMADFTFFGGLYRGVNLVVTDSMSFDLEDYGSDGVFVSQTNISKETAKFDVDVNVANYLREFQNAKVLVEVLDAQENTVLTAEKTSTVMQLNNLKFSLTLDNPILWNSTDNPYLYEIKVTLFNQEETKLDEIDIKTGFRFFSFDPKEGFYLNGEHLKLNGVSRHQCVDGAGWAQKPEHQERDIEIIKEIGANSIRLAHYQQHSNFYSLCDEAGFVIWAEIPFISRSSKTDKNGENAISQMTELVKQNYNHSSIIMWGVQNEITIGGKVNDVEHIVEKNNEIAKRLDPYRVTTQAQVGHHPDKDSMHEITDIVAYNKYYGWYYGEVEDFDGWLSLFDELNPKLSLGISEYGVEGILDYHTSNPQVKDYTEEYHALYHEKVMPIFNAHKEVWGTYVWNMFDFASAIRDEGGVQGMNNKGLVTYDRSIKKDAFYYYKALWSKDDVLHITSKRFEKRNDSEIYVKVYTNLDDVTLFVNGNEIATKSPDNYTIIFENIKLIDGENEIEVKSGNSSDKTTFIRTDEDTSSYVFEDDGKGVSVDNWFNEDLDIDSIVPGEILVVDGKFSINDPIGDIFDNPDGKKVLDKYIASMMDSPMFEMAKGFSFAVLKDFDKDTFNDKLLFALNEELRQVDKK